MSKLVMSLFPVRSIISKQTSCIKACLLWFALLGSCAAQAQTIVPPQSESNSFTPADSEFVMQVSRVNNEVLITLTFKDSLVFEYADIERRADFNSEFSRCKYIPYDEVKNKGRHLVKKDTYPYAGSNDVLYRLKLVTADGAERIFPPVDLPPVKK